MHVAIAIVGFRNADDVAGCLHALGLSTYADFEVIVCENGGPEAFAALASRSPPGVLPGGQLVRAVMAPSNLGYGGGVNVCLRETPTADAWWVLNPDTSPEPDAMSLQVERLSAGDCEAVGCTLHLPNGKVQSHGGHWNAWWARAVSIGHSTSQEEPVDPAAIEGAQNYLNGASMMIGRRFLNVVGPLREDYFLYCEEVEWCLRGGLRGMRLGYAPGAVVLHYQGTTTGSSEHIAKRSPMSIYLIARNQLLLTRDLFPRRLAVTATGAIVALAAKYLRRGAWRQFGYAMSGWSASLRNEQGVPDRFGPHAPPR